VSSTATALPPFLTDAEIAGICDGLTLAAAQCRHMERLGLLVRRKPNGRPLVARSEFERVLGAGRFDKAQNDPSSGGPNVVGLMQHLAKRKPHGKTTQGR
jgi:hypothetical protein